MNTYLKKANLLYDLSRKELNSAKQLNNNELAREASGKVWLAVTDALKGFLISQGLKQNELPKSDRKRQDMMVQYGNEKMRFLYGYIRNEYHQTAYYEGIINYTILFEALGDVKKFIHRCGNGG